MKFFIDTADIEEIKKAADLGVLDGVTTNPTLVAKTGRNYEEVVQEICKITTGPVSAEVIATDYHGMMEEAKHWSLLAPNIVVKIPLIETGLKAVRTCAKEGIRTNVTLCFSAAQALLAAKAGATYISPFVGRLDDISIEGMDLISHIKTIYTNYAYQTEILVASIRSPLHLQRAALLGADIATIPFDVVKKLIKHPLTDIGLATFLADAQKIPLRS